MLGLYGGIGEQMAKYRWSFDYSIKNKVGSNNAHIIESKLLTSHTA